MANEEPLADPSENVAVFVAELRERFGPRAVAVADAQCELATGESREVWTLIVARLRGL